MLASFRFHSSMISACGVSGIAAHLTFLGNWQATPTCMGYLWYLGLDMQLYMIAPFLIHALYKQPALGRLVSAVFVVVSMFLRAGYCSAYGVCHKSDVDIPVGGHLGETSTANRCLTRLMWAFFSSSPIQDRIQPP